MNVGILHITHPGAAAHYPALLERLLGRVPLALEAFQVGFDDDPQALLPLASAALRRVNKGAGVLILTDLYGASPGNFAAKLTGLGTPARRVSGLNLPMLWQGSRKASAPPLRPRNCAPSNARTNTPAPACSPTGAGASLMRLMCLEPVGGFCRSGSTNASNRLAIAPTSRVGLQPKPSQLQFNGMKRRHLNHGFACKGAEQHPLPA